MASQLKVMVHFVSEHYITLTLQHSECKTGLHVRHGCPSLCQFWDFLVLFILMRGRGGPSGEFKLQCSFLEGWHRVITNSDVT